MQIFMVAVTPEIVMKDIYNGLQTMNVPRAQIAMSQLAHVTFAIRKFS